MGILIIHFALLVYVLYHIWMINVINRRDRIMGAITNYACDNLELVTPYYQEMEPFEKTFLRFWDWGYERILPAETFEKDQTLY